ncbi:transferase family protein [Dothidotthia symphoricarpi CBS 119687]|uniref:Transferase family protein n=1 Tax=Dothidotthia symphoricarpi CBS 119687 TaxID=1392245 RepID=A0A6A6ABB5_9PLEO|nr:transferase family protein [Dothidotthia symphoricarpi CBS 119687]KAF2128513.1 transferase family protein [Dothidotthia symphoricarpi CBS 119687]
MTPPTTPNGPHVVRNSRVLPQQPASCECAVPLSLLDATTAKFGLSSAIWLLERPTISLASDDLANHLRTTLSTTLDAYPQWCGYLKGILSIDDDSLPPETTSFPAHAKRYGRVYVHYGTSTDPGVEFVEATSIATVDSLYSVNSAKRRPVWNRRGDEETLTQFVPPTNVVLALEPNERDTNGLYKPIMAVQCTKLACGGHVLAVKIAHPCADIAALTRFVRDWASVSRAILTEAPLPVLSPVFKPLRLDASAAGNINADDADPAIMKDALSLPLHRYDWWAPPATPPSPFPPDLSLAGKPLPWAEWDTNAPVDQCTVHFSRKQIDHLWQSAIQESSLTSSNLKISKHDALLAHVWSCVVRARGLREDQGPVHCDLVLGTRPAFQLNNSFMGSPTVMLNIEMAASHVASGRALGPIAHRIRETVSTVNDSQRLAAHLHSIAYEKSPQRIWQAFLGQRHILVTTWARAGIYDIEFGLGSCIRYADGVVPCVDGCILIVDGPPTEPTPPSSTTARGWTDNGVDITFPLRCEDMERLLQDPLLLPQV